MVKKYISKNKLSGIVAVLVVAFLIGLFVSFRPDLIHKLKKQYVRVSYDAVTKTVDYKIVKDRPSAWTRLNEISGHAVWAVVISEDWAFYEHEGVDFRQVQKAVRDHLKGGRLRGASTLTQQLAKNIFLNHERSFLRKMREAGMAMVMEHSLDKQRILEHYLNIVEFGEGIYGIAMASEFYFNKGPAKLTAKEGAFLAMLLPSPKKYAVSYEEKELTDYASQTIEDILKKLNQAKILSDEQLHRELGRRLPFLKRSRPTKNISRPRQKKAKTTRPKSSARKTGLNDGRGFEERYLNDPDLALAPEQEFDPSQLDEVDLGVEVEFSLE